jgi:hypothetical protein
VVTFSALVAALLTVQVAAVIADRSFQANLDVVTRSVNLRSDEVVGEIHGQATVTQTFRAAFPNLSRVEVRLATYARVDDVSLRLELRSSSGRLLRVAQAPPGAVQDNTFHTFEFAPIPQSEGVDYMATLRSLDARPGNALTVWVGRCNCYPLGHLILSGIERNDLEMALQVGYATAADNWLTELLHRLSQYKPGFFKGSIFVLLMLLWLIFAIVALTILVASASRRPEASVGHRLHGPGSS